jgi:taurine dioxygenase
MDMPRDESYALIKLLSDRALVPENQCRFRWRENSIAIWDNRAVQHYACFDYPGQRRLLHRVTILDSNPWPSSAEETDRA